MLVSISWRAMGSSKFFCRDKGGRVQGTAGKVGPGTSLSQDHTHPNFRGCHLSLQVFVGRGGNLSKPVGLRLLSWGLVSLCTIGPMEFGGTPKAIMQILSVKDTPNLLSPSCILISSTIFCSDLHLNMFLMFYPQKRVCKNRSAFEHMRSAASPSTQLGLWHPF